MAHFEGWAFFGAAQFPISLLHSIAPRCKTLDTVAPKNMRSGSRYSPKLVATATAGLPAFPMLTNITMPPYQEDNRLSVALLETFQNRLESLLQIHHLQIAGINSDSSSDSSDDDVLGAEESAQPSPETEAFWIDRLCGLLQRCKRVQVRFG